MMSSTQLPGRNGKRSGNRVRKLSPKLALLQQTTPGENARRGLTVQGHATQIPPEKLLLQQMPGVQQTPLQQTCSSPSPQGKMFRRGDQAVRLVKVLHSWH